MPNIDHEASAPDPDPRPVEPRLQPELDLAQFLDEGAEEAPEPGPPILKPWSNGSGWI